MSKKKPCELKGTAGAIAAIPYREPQQADNHCLEGSWDLHTHSTFSDGEYTVEELIEQARACGLARIAITDHDSVSQLSRPQLPGACGVRGLGCQSQDRQEGPHSGVWS